MRGDPQKTDWENEESEIQWRNVNTCRMYLWAGYHWSNQSSASLANLWEPCDLCFSWMVPLLWKRGSWAFIHTYAPLTEDCSWKRQLPPNFQACALSSLTWKKAWRQKSRDTRGGASCRPCALSHPHSVLKSGGQKAWAGHTKALQYPNTCNFRLSFLCCLIFVNNFETWKGSWSHVGTAQRWEMRTNSMNVKFWNISRSWNDGPTFRMGLKEWEVQVKNVYFQTNNCKDKGLENTV